MIRSSVKDSTRFFLPWTLPSVAMVLTQATLVLPTVVRKDFANILSGGRNWLLIMLWVGRVVSSQLKIVLILILMEWWQEFFLISCGSNFICFWNFRRFHGN